MSKAIVYTVSSLYYRHLGVSIVNMQRTNHDLYDAIVVVEYDLSEEQKSFLKKIEPRCAFVHYTPEDFREELCVNDSELYHGLYYKDHACVQLGKHVIFKLLQQYDKILLLEVDMIVNGDISEIFNHSGCAYVYYYEFNDYVKTKSDADLETELGYDINCTNGKYATNGGLFYIDKTIDSSAAYELALSTKRKYVKSSLKSKLHNPGAIDELCISYVILKLASKVRNLNYRLYNSLVNKYGMRDNVKIVHAFQDYKPWSNYQVLSFFPEWEESYNQWVNLGGEAIESLVVEKRILSLANNFQNELILRILGLVSSKYSNFLSYINIFGSDDLFSKPYSYQIKAKSVLKFKFSLYTLLISINKSKIILSVDFGKSIDDDSLMFINLFVNKYSKYFNLDYSEGKYTLISKEISNYHTVEHRLDIIVSNLKNICGGMNQPL